MPELTSDIREVFSNHSEELKDVEKELLNLFNSPAFLIPAIGNHIARSGGKRIRPLFLILSSELCGYNGYASIVLASIIEAIHTASLLHDDIVDGAELRRGQPTAHTLWGNQVVVLVGDYLYANALRIAVHQKNQKIMETLSEATTRMTEGELLQLSKMGDPDMRKEEYLQIISAKTGALISAACRIGAILGGKDKHYETALANFGMMTGIAFQIVDDILDYMADKSDLGKRLGKDLDEGKVTMPVIYLLNACSSTEREEVRTIVTAEERNGDSLRSLSSLFKRYNVIEGSMAYARKILQKAQQELDIFEPSQMKESIICLSDYALQRRV